MTFADIAEKTGFEKSVVSRLMRDAMCMRIFREPEQGVVQHTKVSKALRQPGLLAFVRAGAEEGWANMFKVKNFPLAAANISPLDARLADIPSYRLLTLWRNGPPVRSPAKR